MCQQVVELVSDYLEGSLSRSDRRRFEAHLRKCPNCTNYLEQMRATIRATGALHPDDLSPEVQTRVHRSVPRRGGTRNGRPSS